VFTVEAVARAYGRQATLCHPGVDFDRFRPLPDGTHDTVLSVGALDPSKGHDRCLAAMALLPRDRYPALTVAYERSDPAFERQLREQAAAADIDLRLRVSVSDTTLAALYASASVTVAAATLEPLGLTVLESIAAGTPVVALRQGGYRETVTDGVNGLLVDADRCSLAHAIVAATDLARRTSPDAIRASVRDYWTWDRCVRDLHCALHRTVQA
jgi:glycosyltransferase involved in cell wall biosynthesis